MNIKQMGLKIKEIMRNMERNVSIITELEAKDDVKYYKYLLETNESLMQELMKLNLELEKQELYNCKHIFITSKKTINLANKRNEAVLEHSCIKCGLSSCFSAFYDDDTITQKESQMGEIYRQTYKNGNFINALCDKRLAMAIYKEVISFNPKASDNEIILYFNNILSSIRENAINDDSKEQFVKRLGLSPDFQNWTEKSVTSKQKI